MKKYNFNKNTNLVELITSVTEMENSDLLKNIVDSGRCGNTYRINENLYVFSRYNILNLSERIDGHYSIIVDIRNFSFVVYKIGGFGGLTWMSESDDKTIYGSWELNELEYYYFFFYVIHQMSMAYEYDSNHVNQWGMNLFPSEFDLSNDLKDYVVGGNIAPYSCFKGACIFDLDFYTEDVQLGIKKLNKVFVN